MTIEEVERMEAGDLNAAVAERVMGWARRPDATYEWESPDRPHPPGTAVIRWHHRPPDYATSVYADYEVLGHVREAWEKSRRVDFVVACRELWERRGHIGSDPYLYYQPGDYAKAALLAATDEKGAVRQ